MSEEVEQVEVAEVERADDVSLSQQPRFHSDAGILWMRTVERWYKELEVDREPYAVDSRKRDSWLRKWSRREPYWNAVLRSCAMLDANRGWSFIGGRNQVNRFTAVMHDADEGAGWRSFCMRESNAFRISDLGAVTELGRQGGEGGPVRAIYFTDPVQCRMTGEIKTPLEYTPAAGQETNPQRWTADDYFRVVSMPSTDESLLGLGWCATSSAFELLMLLYGVMLHDQERLGSRMPQGLLLLQGISQEQWSNALEARESQLNAQDRARFGGVMVLATEGDLPPQARLEALSSLPDAFDRQAFIESVWYGYAAIVGRDASEFFPIQTGSIGRGFEPEIQHRKAVTKGGAEFTLAWQEQWQNVLPPTLHFQFDEKDEEGELLEAEVAGEWTSVYTKIYQAGGAFAAQPITAEQYLALLAEKGIVPEEWTEAVEDETATDIEEARERLVRAIYLRRMIENPDVMRAVEAYPTDPIVWYRWTPSTIRQRVLWPSGRDAVAQIRRMIWRGFGRVVRQDGEIVYANEAEGFTITDEDIDRALAAGAKMVPPGDDEQEDPGLRALYEAQEVEERGLLAGMRAAWERVRERATRDA